MNPTTTLARIRDHSPCADGWARGLKTLGPDLDAPISLGDIAKSNGASDTFWCVRALDWSDLAVRRAVIGGAVLPAVRRAHRYAHGEEPEPAYLADLARWCAGDDNVDLEEAVERARKAYNAAPVFTSAAIYAAYAADAAYAAIRATSAAYADLAAWAAWAAIRATTSAAYAYAYADVATSAAYAYAYADVAASAAAAAASLAASAAERAFQCADIIAAFPCLRPAGQ